MNPTLEIPRELIAAIIAQCEKEKPDETCGLLAGRGNRVEKLVPAENTDHSPATYSIAPTFLMRTMKELRAEGLDITGVYHSHPAGAAAMSLRDLELASEDFFYLVVSREKSSTRLQCFLVLNAEPLPVEMRVV